MNVRCLKGDKFTIACHEFLRRKLFICGVSEHWMSDSGTLHDPATNVWFLYIGHIEADNSPGGKHGVGFLMSNTAYRLWKQQGSIIDRRSPRVISLGVSLSDHHGSPVSFFFIHGYSVQQNCCEADRLKYWLSMQSVFDSAPPKSTRVLTMDINASIGVRGPHDVVPVCGSHGLSRVSPAGEDLKVWLAGNGLYAISTHFPLPLPTGKKGGGGSWFWHMASSADSGALSK